MGRPPSLDRRLSAAAAGLLALGLLSACATPQVEAIGQEPVINPTVTSTDLLAELPPAQNRLPVAIYEFVDQTGQRKPNDNVAELSTAVTQGAAAILMDAAFRAGGGSWFQVIERAGLDGLLQERQIIRQVREQFVGAAGQPLPPPQPLLYAGVILQGGIISYDTNTVTGGAGARFLGIGGNAEYRSDTIAVYLRAVSTQTGEVIASVNTTKTIFSVKVQANVFKFVEFDELLELDAGITSNEPTQLAVRKAVETALYAMIMEGVQDGLWTFADDTAGARALQAYFDRTDPDFDPDTSVMLSGAPRPRPRPDGA